MKSLLPLASTLLLCQCAPYLAGRADGIDPNPYSLLEKQAKPENRDPQRISVPVLSSAVLEKRWGKPKLLVGPKGGYALRYEDPRHRGIHLTIFGSPDMFPIAGAFPPPYTDLGLDPRSGSYTPREVRQSWKVARIGGRNVRYCISEARSPGEPVQYSTETFRLTGPDGRTASYRLRAAVIGDAGGIRDLLETAGF